MGLFARSALRLIALHVFIATIAGVALYLVIDLVEVGNVAAEKSGGALLAQLTLWNLPRVLRSMLPVAAPLGTLTAIAALVRRREIEATLAAGASPLLGALPVLCAGCAIALIHAANVEWLVPASATEVGALRKRLGLGSGPLEVYGKRQTWFQGKELVYRVSRLADARGESLEDVLVLRIDGGRLVERWDLAALSRIDNRWVGRGVVHHTLGDTLITTRTASAVMPVRETPNDFVLSVAPPERLGTGELIRTAETRERIGRPSPVHWTEVGRRFSLPIGLALSMLLSSALALRLGRRVSLARALGVGSAIGLLCWFLGDLSALLGASGAVSPWTSTLVAPLLVLAGLGAAARAVMRRGVGD